MTSTLTAADVDHVLSLDATGQAALVRTGEVTAEDLFRVAVDRIERLNGTLNAVVIKAYDEAERAVQAGLPDGPFTGVPYLLKDLAVEMRGLPLHQGSAFLRDYVSTRDSTIVGRLRRAGLVVLGRTASCEFGMKPTVETRRHGATRNPWDLDRSTGGSSGGAAAAVAGGMVPMAGADDAGGSIRIPASACGLFGLKPSRARTPYAPHYGDYFAGLSVEHALTRSVRDSAALLDATHGPALGDPYSVPPPARPYVDEVGAPPGRLRIALTTKPADGRTADPECVRAALDTAALCESLGHVVVERDLDELTPAVGAAIGTTYGAAIDWCIRQWADVLGREPAEDELEPLTRAYWEQGRTVTAGEYLVAVTELQAFSRRVASAMTEFDVWLSPTLGTLPPALGAMRETDEEPTRGSEVAADLVSFPLITANISGSPAMSVPLTWTEDGIPVGSHFLGRYGREDVLFRLAAQLEGARPWGHRRPTLVA